MWGVDEGPPARGNAEGGAKANNQNTDDFNDRLNELKEECFSFATEKPRDFSELAVLLVAVIRAKSPIFFRWFAELVLEQVIDQAESENEWANRSAAHMTQRRLRREKYIKHHGRWPDPAAAGLEWTELLVAAVRDHIGACGPFEVRAYAVATWLRLTPRERRAIVEFAEGRSDEN